MAPRLTEAHIPLMYIEKEDLGFLSPPLPSHYTYIHRWVKYSKPLLLCPSSEQLQVINNPPDFFCRIRLKVPTVWFYPRSKSPFLAFHPFPLILLGILFWISHLYTKCRLMFASRVSNIKHVLIILFFKVLCCYFLLGAFTNNSFSEL